MATIFWITWKTQRQPPKSSQTDGNPVLSPCYFCRGDYVFTCLLVGLLAELGENHWMDCNKLQKLEMRHGRTHSILGLGGGLRSIE